jgi:oxalate---CoA ligase
MRRNNVFLPADSASLWSAFQRCATCVGDVEAIVSPGRESLRFAELPGMLASIRDALAGFGVGRGDRVVSVLPRGPETALCFLGVSSCAVYVPLNPEYTEAEFAKYLTELRPKALIVSKGAGGAAVACASALAIPVIELVVEPGKPAGSFSLISEMRGEPAVPAWSGAEDVALILLTSGSSSGQKLVPMRQRHLLAYAQVSGDHYGLGPQDRCLHVMPMFHGHGLKSTLLVPLANGSGVICPRAFDVRSFFEQIQAFRPTWYSAAASIHHAIFERIGEFRDVARNAKLRFIRSGSGRLDPKVMAGLEEAFGAPMLERYGMSEACTLTSNPFPPGLRKPGTVGKVIFNEVAILDEAGNAVGPGCTGEVVTRGPGVFDGYLDNPEATAAAFVNGWFRTGDLGRFDEDGYLTLMGRLKEVINRGGEKIGTLEVEAALLRHPAVADVCVFPIPHPSLGEEVAAAIVLASHLEVTERELRAHARGMLTGFKVPRRIYMLPVLPKSATNKIRRDEVVRICASIQAASAQAAATRAQPSMWSALEREIAVLWKRTLGPQSAEIDRDDDFFLLGGDSLQACELFEQLRRQYGITLGLRHLFDDAATVAGMARLVERGRRSALRQRGKLSRLVPIKEDGERPPLFAMPGSGGNPVGFVHLGRLLDQRQPLYGIEARGLDGADPPLSRVEDIAADNIAAIREMQPTGPYFLSGACYGARVAYEMARQLEAAGERIGLLLMLDPSSPFHRADGRLRGEADGDKPVKPGATVVRFVADRIVMHATAFARLRGAQRAAFVREKLSTLRDIMKQRDLFRGDRSEYYRRLVYAANRAAGSRYVPGSFGGPAVVCLTRDRPVRGERNYRLDWLEVVPQCGAPRYVAGQDSGAMLNLPHVYELASFVNRWLDAAHVRSRTQAEDSARSA